jgi:hypothetical protein
MNFVNFINDLYKTNCRHTNISVINSEIDSFPTFESFENYINHNLPKFKQTNSRIYDREELEAYVQLDINSLSNNNILLQNTYNYIISNNNEYKISIIKNEYTELFAKLKKETKKKLEPSDYRYIMNHSTIIKLLDHLWLLKIRTVMPINIINSSIFICKLTKTNNICSCLTYATENTLIKKNILLLDIKKAFDSVEWSLLYEKMLSFFNKFMSPINSINLVNQYFIVLNNRKFKYRDYDIFINKGISQGLASSNFVFTIFILEILYKWKYYKNLYYNYFKLNIYVDDFYIEFLINDQEIIKDITNTLITLLEDNYLYTSKEKSKADSSLYFLEYPVLENNDMYLGIPFTRNIKEYFDIILTQFKNRYFDYTWYDIFYRLDYNEELEEKNIIRGFMNYKLKPLVEYYNEESISSLILYYFINV